MQSSKKQPTIAMKEMDILKQKLREEMMEIRDQTIEEETENESDKNLKQDLVSIANKLNSFNDKCYMDVIENIYYDNPNELLVASSIDNAKLSAKGAIKKL